MWTVNTCGKLAYVPSVKHIRSALGTSYVPDVVTLMERTK
jgi:hypothetical protein